MFLRSRSVDEARPVSILASSSSWGGSSKWFSLVGKGPRIAGNCKEAMYFQATAPRDNKGIKKKRAQPSLKKRGREGATTKI